MVPLSPEMAPGPGVSVGQAGAELNAPQRGSGVVRQETWAQQWWWWCARCGRGGAGCGSPVHPPARLPDIQLQLAPEKIGVDAEEFAQRLHSESAERSLRGGQQVQPGLLLEKGQLIGWRRSQGRNRGPTGRASFTWAPSGRSSEVRVRRLLTALSKCRRRAPGASDELASRAWLLRMASESRLRPCHTSTACCST